VRDHDESTGKEEDVRIQNDDPATEQGLYIVLSHPAWRLPVNVNVEEGESKKQLLQIRELSFGQSEVFAYFGKEDS
jgi:hypothetical protein